MFSVAARSTFFFGGIVIDDEMVDDGDYDGFGVGVGVGSDWKQFENRESIFG